MKLRDRLRQLRRVIRRTLLLGVVAIVVAVTALAIAWQNRPALEDLNWPEAAPARDTMDSVFVTWLGVSTLLIDDGETQLLIDGFFSRPTLADLLLRKISPDTAAVNLALADFRINRLAAIIPTQSHFDHAMDLGVIANRSSAVVLGSESSANIVVGARLPIQQYQILADRESRTFGDFTITLLVSRHAPTAIGNEPWFDGKISEPLQTPARVSAWKEGQTYAVHVAHPRGSLLVQSSGGFIRDNLRNINADVVMLGIGGIESLGRDYVGQLWQQTVGLTGALRVYPLHYDDFTQPFGTVMPFPPVLDDVVTTAGWINEFAAMPGHEVLVERLPFGIRVGIF